MNSNLWTTGKISLGLGWAELIFGAWLIVSPFVLGFAHEKVGLINNIASGVILILLTLASTRNGLMRIFIILLGWWLYATAFALSVPEDVYLWNDLSVALLVIITAVASETPYPPNYRPDASRR